MLTKHSLSIESLVETDFDCSRCGYAGTATLLERGQGGGTSMFGLGRKAAAAAAEEQALEDLRHQAKVQATLLACPQCQRRSLAAVGMFACWTALGAALLGGGAVVARGWLASWLLAVVLGLLAISFVVGRVRQYRRAGQPIGIQVRPRVPEARVVRVKPVVATRPEPLDPGDTPRFLS